MEELEIKHLTPYLPHGLYIKVDDRGVLSMDSMDDECVVSSYNNFTKINYHISDIKPILRPLSSMTKEEAYELGVLLTSEADMEDIEVGVGGIDVFGEYYTVVRYQDKVDEEYSFMIQFSPIGIVGINLIPYEAYEWLFKNHFDVFGLIEKGLAIDKTTFK